jgi:hypothetical protein
MHKFDALSITFARLGIILSGLAKAIGQQICVQFNFFVIFRYLNILLYRVPFSPTPRYSFNTDKVGSKPEFLKFVGPRGQKIMRSASNVGNAKKGKQDNFIANRKFTSCYIKIIKRGVGHY